MKKMDTQLKQTLEEIGKQAFPDDQDAWAKIQQRMERKGTPNIMTNRKEQQLSLIHISEPTRPY